MIFENLERDLLEFLEENLKKTGKRNFIVGLSGGLDSAVVTALCSEVAKTYAIIMPAVKDANLDDALSHALKFNLTHEIVSIKPLLDAYPNQNLSNHRRGNLMARFRMVTLYDLSEEFDAVVVGTSNLSERLLGYSTIYGDSACAFNPIGEIFKTEIFKFAKHLNIDEKIISKSPSAELFEGQSDESDLGYSYEELDAVLKEYYDGGVSFDELKTKQDKNIVEFIEKRVRNNAFKLKMPEIAQIRSKSLKL
ncbi:MAG: NAD+ synthase [Campylobacteraceae bacterium]|nr:NAD+ synthase [Campylobacteraceae bacterium]